MSFLNYIIAFFIFSGTITAVEIPDCFDPRLTSKPGVFLISVSSEGVDSVLNQLEPTRSPKIIVRRHQDFPTTIWLEFKHLNYMDRNSVADVLRSMVLNYNAEIFCVQLYSTL